MAYELIDTAYVKQLEKRVVALENALLLLHPRIDVWRLPTPAEATRIIKAMGDSAPEFEA